MDLKFRRGMQSLIRVTLRNSCIFYLVAVIFSLSSFIWITNKNSMFGAIIMKSVNTHTVGFDELKGSDCMDAISRPVNNNNKFVKSVERKSLERIRNDSRKCDEFREEYGFNRYPPPSTEEKQFALAFTLLFHKDFDQVLYLLRAVYRPHNVYCLTVDLNTDEEFRHTVGNVTNCFSNIFMASKMEHIVYGGFERLKADINCMVDLIAHPVQWKYVINMVGQQFPLRTNLEIVRILQLYKQTSDIEIGPIAGRMEIRYLWKHVYVKEKNGIRIYHTWDKNPPPPQNITFDTIRKGSAFGSFSREFIQFAVTSQLAKDFLEWCKEVESPDEYFWSTLQYGANLDVPGGNKGLMPQKNFITVFAAWPHLSCATMRVRSICIFSPQDLPMLDQKHALFANKFYITHHPAALHCLDERIYNLTVSREVRNLSFF